MDATAWISALSSLVLVGVTTWYAVLTHGLAKSARDSAASALRAAELSAEALAASVAALDVDFWVAPNARRPDKGDGLALGVTIQCTGATVFIHRAHLDMAYSLDEVDEDGVGTSYTSVADDVELVLDRTGTMNVLPVELPVRVHKGEMVHFDSAPQIVRDANESTGILEVSVWYSLTREAEPLVRRVSYTAPGPD